MKRRSIASRRAQAAIRRARVRIKAITGGHAGRYDERVADVGVPLKWDQAEAIDRTPGELKTAAQEAEGSAAALSALATSMRSIATQAAQSKACPHCGKRQPADTATAAALSALAAGAQQQAAQLRELAEQLRRQAEDVDDAADQIGRPGATLWFGENSG